jgi:hypothetical protein
VCFSSLLMRYLTFVQRPTGLYNLVNDITAPLLFAFYGGAKANIFS